MSTYFSFFLGLLSAALSFDLFQGLIAILLVSCAFRLVWWLCAPLRFSGGRTDA